MEQNLRIRELINRIARFDAMQAWEADLNPAQTAVLEYLARANRFSRSPSHVADYLGTTRGTVSQSLKSLGQKGHVTEQRSSVDRRIISFDLTQKGSDAVKATNVVNKVLAQMKESSGRKLEASLEAVLVALLKDNKGRFFGICKDCQHFSAKENGGYCLLLSEALEQQETNQICHEQVPA